MKESFRRIVWKGVFNSEHLAQYYPRIESRLRVRHRWFVIAAVGLASLASTCLILGLAVPSTWGVVSTAMTAGGLGSTIASVLTTIWAYRGESLRNIYLASIAASRWRNLASQWLLLWAEMSKSGDSKGVRETLRRLMEEERVVILETDCGAYDEGISSKSDTAARDVLEGVFED